MVLRGVKRKLRNACAMQREGWEGLLGTIDSDGDGEVTLLEVGFLSYEMYSNLYAYPCVCVCVYHVCVCVCVTNAYMDIHSCNYMRRRPEKPRIVSAATVVILTYNLSNNFLSKQVQYLYIYPCIHAHEQGHSNTYVHIHSQTGAKMPWLASTLVISA